MTWKSIDELKRDPFIEEALAMARQGDRLAIEHALVASWERMRRFGDQHAGLPWEGLKPDAAVALDRVVRNQIALGFFRTTFAAKYSGGRTPITALVDQAADAIEAHGAREVFAQLRREKDGLGAFDAGQQSAFHQLLAALGDKYGMPVMRLASIATGAALSVDVVLENVEDDDEADQQLADLRRGVARSIQSHARRKELPLVHGAALWVLAMRGRGSVFGEQEQTASYTEHDD